MNSAASPSNGPAHRMRTPNTPEPVCARCIRHVILDGVEAVVFDFDGTIGDTTPGQERALRAALRDFGIALDPAWYRQHVGLSIHDLLSALPDARELPHDEIIRTSRGQLLAAVDSITPIDCVVSLLHAARRAALPSAIASGASGLLVHPALAALGLTAAFGAIVVREDAPRGKPAPDLYLEAARRLGIPPSRCLAVDDAPDGIASARTAGMQVLTLVDGHLAHADARPPRPAQHRQNTPAPADDAPRAPQNGAPESPHGAHQPMAPSRTTRGA